MKVKVKRLLSLAKRCLTGYMQFRRSGSTPPAAYLAMRSLSIETNNAVGRLMAALAPLRSRPYQDIEANGVLGRLSRRELSDIADRIRRDGFYSFGVRVPEESLRRLREFAEKTPLRCLQVGEADQIRYSEREMVFDRRHVVSPRYQVDQQRLVENEATAELIADPTLLGIAQAYLRCRPVMDVLAMWWSVPFEGRGKSEAAQLYHFDLDRLRFLKFFFYLSNVDRDTGPHCYVRSSHRRVPREFLRDGRFSDEQVASAYPLADRVELTGEAGTVIAVDTRGLHKGKELLRDERLLFQIQFSASRFGANYAPLRLTEQSPPGLRRAVEIYPDTYGPIFGLS